MNVSICEVTAAWTLFMWLCSEHRTARAEDPNTSIRDAWPRQRDAHVISWLGLICDDCGRDER